MPQHWALHKERVFCFSLVKVSICSLPKGPRLTGFFFFKNRQDKIKGKGISYMRVTYKRSIPSNAWQCNCWPLFLGMSWTGGGTFNDRFWGPSLVQPQNKLCHNKMAILVYLSAVNRDFTPCSKSHWWSPFRVLVEYWAIIQPHPYSACRLS